MKNKWKERTEQRNRSMAKCRSRFVIFVDVGRCAQYWFCFVAFFADCKFIVHEKLLYWRGRRQQEHRNHVESRVVRSLFTLFLLRLFYFACAPFAWFVFVDRRLANGIETNQDYSFVIFDFFSRLSFIFLAKVEKSGKIKRKRKQFIANTSCKSSTLAAARLSRIGKNANGQMDDEANVVVHAANR